MLNSPKYFEGRKVHILIPCSPVVKENGLLNQNYLVYDQTQAAKHLSYSGSIKGFSPELREFTVATRDVNCCQVELRIPSAEVFMLNNGQTFNKRGQNSIELEDGIVANYETTLVKAKLFQIAIELESVVAAMDFCSGDIEDWQKLAVKTVRRQLNLISFAKGVDKGRVGRTDCVGKLAVNGQAQCHGLTSTLIAYLLPFAEMLGLEVKYRGGFSFLTQLKGGEQEIRVSNSVEKHQWAEVNCRPRMSTFLVDVWYQDALASDDFLAVDVAEAMQTVSYPHPKLLLKSRAEDTESRHLCFEKPFFEK